MIGGAAERRRSDEIEEIDMETGPDEWVNDYAKWAKAYEAWAKQEVARKAAEAQPATRVEPQVTRLDEMDEAWKKRLLFVMYRRPDAVASR